MKKLLCLLALTLASVLPAHGQACNSVGYTITNPFPVTCVPYSGNAKSITPKRLPGDIMSHLAAGGVTRAQTLLGGSNGAGDTIRFATPGSDDAGVPLYISAAGDPFFKTSGCNSGTFTGNAPFRAPDRAATKDESRQDLGYTGDNNLRIYDPSTGQAYGVYPGGWSSTTPWNIGHSTATTSGTAVTVTTGAAYCGFALDFWNDRDWGTSGNTPHGWFNAQGAEGSMGLAPFAGIVRNQELIQGVVNHALVLGGACTNAYNGSYHVFPSSIDTAHCTVATNMPPNGALIFFDYTDAEIASMTNLKPIQRTMITAMSHFGGYMDVTGGASGTGGMGFQPESGLAYQFQTGGTIGAQANGMTITGGTRDPIYAYLETQGIYGSGSSGTSTKYNWNWLANVPTIRGTGLSGHVFMADPCVALGLAGEPGGCVSNPGGVPHVDTPSINFGPVNVGSLTASQRITFTNSSAAAVTLTVNVGNSTVFPITNNTCTQGINVLPGANCHMDAAFQPNATGPLTSTILFSASNMTTVTVNLTGTGLAIGQTFFGNATPNWGDVTVGQTKLFTIILHNPSNGVAQTGITYALTTGTQFHIATYNGPQCGTTMGMETGTVPETTGQCSVTMSCVPTSAGAKSDILTYHSDQGTSTATLSCNGLAPPSPPTGGGNPQTHNVSGTEPLQQLNAAWVNGIAPGYWPRNCQGLNVCVGPGFVVCDGTPTGYAGGTLAMTDNTTNYIFLDHLNSCAPTASTSATACADPTIATVVTSGGAITAITDSRTPFKYCAGSGSGDASTNTTSSVDSEFALFSGTGGKTLKRSTATGIMRGASGVSSAAELSGAVTTSGSNVTHTKRAISFTFGSPTGSALTTSETRYIRVPFACTIDGYSITVDAGTATVKTWRTAGGTAIPTVSNSISTSGVSISSGTTVHSSTVTDWTSTAIAADDNIAVNLSAVATAKILNFVLECTQ